MDLGSDIERGEIGGNAESRCAAFVRISWIGRNRFDGQEFEKSIETIVALGIDSRKNLIEIGHGCLPLVAGFAGAASTIPDRSS
jgi:hypothetical protein